MSAIVFNYMPTEASDADLKLCGRICRDDKKFSDASGLSNKAKWETVQYVFDSDECNLFSIISFETIYQNDEPNACNAAAYMADLRVQFLEHHLMTEDDDIALHNLWMINKQWYVRLRERANLYHIQKALRGVLLT